MRKDVLALACAGSVALAACGGGGDPAPAQQPSTPAATQPRDYHQAFVTWDPSFTSSSLTLVKAANFTQRTPLGATAAFDTLYAGTHVNGVIEDYRPHSMYFVQNSVLNRVDLRSGSPVAVRVSSEVISDACSLVTLQPAFGSAAGALLLYSKPGTDADCHTADDVFRRVGVTDPSTTAPLSGPIGDEFLPFYDATGVLTAVLAYDYGTGTLRRYGANLASAPTVVGTPGVLVQPLASSNAAALIAYNGAVHHFDAATGALTPPLHTLSGLQDILADDNYLYIVQQASVSSAPQLYRIALDGTQSSELLWEPAADALELVGEIDASIVLATFDDVAGGAVLLLDKATDGTFQPDPIQEFAGMATSGIWVNHSRNPVQYNSIGASGLAAHAITAAGVLTTVGDAEWTGVQYATDFPLADTHSFRHAYPTTGSYRIDGPDFPNSHLNGTVKLVNFATGATQTLVTVDTTEFIYPFSVGAVGMAYVVGEDPAAPYGYQYDALSFDLDDGRIERHSNATLAHEVPYSF